MSAHPVDATAFSVFVMQEVSAASFDAALGSADDALAGAFFWGVDCFNCETAKKTMLAQPDALRSLGFKRFHARTSMSTAGWGAGFRCTAGGQRGGTAWCSSRRRLMWPARRFGLTRRLRGARTAWVSGKVDGKK